VDYITHSIDDGTLYFGVWFKDKTGFSLRYACDMFVVSADFTNLEHRQRKDHSSVHEADFEGPTWASGRTSV
jgi:hypothetical protein